jgi:hypothetical protein
MFRIDFMTQTTPAARRTPQSTVDFQIALDTLKFHETVRSILVAGSPAEILSLLTEAREKTRARGNLTEEYDRLNVYNAFQAMSEAVFAEYLREKIEDDQIEIKQLSTVALLRAIDDFKIIWRKNNPISSDLEEAMELQPLLPEKFLKAKDSYSFSGFLIYLYEEYPLELFRDYIHEGPNRKDSKNCLGVFYASQMAFFCMKPDNFSVWLNKTASRYHSNFMKITDEMVETLNARRSDNTMQLVSRGRDASELLLGPQQVFLQNLLSNMPRLALPDDE